VDIRFVTPGAVEYVDDADPTAWLGREDGFVWIDVPQWSDEAENLLTHPPFGAHPLAIAACKQRNHVPTIHAYHGHVFTIAHSPGIGKRGHVHMLELDSFIGADYLVTVHGPLNPEVSVETATEECDEVLRRIAMGRFKPNNPAELSFAIVSAMARRQRSAIGSVAEETPALERRVMEGDFRHPEDLLEELFLLRHELITIRTMAGQCREIYARITSLDTVVPAEDLRYARDLADQFDRVRSIADGECQFLFGVIELYQTRVTTKMTVAMERLAVIAAVTLPVTAIASVYGMNVIVNEHTHVEQLIVVLIAMLLISGLLLRWARRQGWW
jgi:Mg2+ and Co2+ transporter CorA